jgi:hypothetical protein
LGASEMRRVSSQSAVQAASSRLAFPRATGPRDGGNGNRSQVRRARPGPTAVDRQPANSQGEARSPETVSPPGARRSKPHKHRARDAMETADLRFYGFRQASMLRGVEVRGSVWTLGVPRALGSFRGRRRRWKTAYPAPVKNTGDGACLPIVG